MPVEMLTLEDASLDLTQTEEASIDWEKLATGVYEGGGVYMWCEPCGNGSCDADCGGCGGC